jgi:hydrogenase maturation factor
MSGEVAWGKVTPEVFARAVAPHLGATRPEVVVGPRVGHDAAIVRVGAGRVLATTTDPLSLIPCLGLERSARLACHLVASDLWTTGLPPAYASVTLNLSPSFDDDALARWQQAASEAWSELGIAVVTGHTGRHAGCSEHLIGAATVMGVGDEGRYVTPGMARVGDRILITKSAAFETAAIAAWLCPERVREAVGDDETFARLRTLEREVSVVADCRAAIRAGVRERGVTAMHDATEGGVLGGLCELAAACGHDVRVERERLPLDPAIAAACDAMGVDPWWSCSEGALIVCAAPDRTDAVLGELHEAGIAAVVVGEVLAGHGRLWVGEPSGPPSTFDAPRPDPWWAAYDRAVREGWR